VRTARIKDLLPMVFQEAVEGPDATGPLGLFLYAMQELHAPVESILDNLDRFIDPRRGPDALVQYLASWVGLEPLTMPGQLRESVARYVEISHLRGTRRGLIGVLELVTGMRGFEIAENVGKGGVPQPFHIEVRAPAALRAHQRLLQAVIDREKPVFVTASLEFKDAPAEAAPTPPERA
jgi:phage tail-like protein